MKGKINVLGHLILVRKNGYSAEVCGMCGASCSAACVLFGDPYKRVDGSWAIDLCFKTIVFTEGFTDERR